MPIHNGKGSNGPFYQWGGHGKRYYYVPGNKSSREQAKLKAQQQARAAHANGYTGK